MGLLPHALLAVLVAGGAPGVRGAACPAPFDFDGYGPVSLVPTGWYNNSKEFKGVDMAQEQVIPQMGGRAYFANTCTPGFYDRSQYITLPLLGKMLRYTVDLSGAGCGCNAAFYLASMSQNQQLGYCGDYYCDANSVCGVACAEIDIQEANQFAFHATCHGAQDRSGTGGGYGGYGGHDWTAAQYGPGSQCIDTALPFEVTVRFPVAADGQLQAVETTLTQAGHDCKVSTKVDSYDKMQEISSALAAGMTPVVSYWSANNMLWLDGKGDSNGACESDNKRLCSESVKFYGFSVSAIMSEEAFQEFIGAKEEAAAEQAEEAAEEAQEEAQLEQELQAEEAEQMRQAQQAAAVVVPTLAPGARQYSEERHGLGDFVSRVFNVLGLVRRYETTGRDPQAHGSLPLLWAAATSCTIISAAALIGAAVLSWRRRAVYTQVEDGQTRDLCVELESVA